MVEINQLLVEDKCFLVYKLMLPLSTILIIANTRGYIIATDIFSINETAEKVVCAITDNSKDVETMLKSEITDLSIAAFEKGMYLGMKVKDALKYL